MIGKDVVENTTRGVGREKGRVVRDVKLPELQSKVGEKFTVTFE